MAGKLGSGVQGQHDDFDSGPTLVGVDVNRQAAAVVFDLDPAVGEELDANGAAIAAQGLVDAVVQHLLQQVVGSGHIGVHARPLAHGIKALKDFDGGGVVAAQITAEGTERR